MNQAAFGTSAYPQQPQLQQQQSSTSSFTQQQQQQQQQFVHWRPAISANPDAVFLWQQGVDLRLCQWRPEEKTVQVMARCGEVPLMRCCAWSPVDWVVAVGLTNGRVQLLRLPSSAYDAYQQPPTPASSRRTHHHLEVGSLHSSRQTINSSGFAPNYQPQQRSSFNQATAGSSYSCLGEFIPRNSRACNALEFSTTNKNLLAVGLDKVRNDYCLLIWDTEVHARLQAFETSQSQPTAALFHGSGEEAQQNQMNNNITAPSMQVIRPLYQYGSSEAIASLSWLPHQSHLIGAGMGYKWVRFYDMRQDGSATGGSAPAMVINTKAVYGLQPDPFHEYRLASYGDDGGIKIWDLRRPSEPVLSLPTESRVGLISMEFSSTQPAVLTSLNRDTNIVDIWRLQTSPAAVDTLDLSQSRGVASANAAGLTGTPQTTLASSPAVSTIHEKVTVSGGAAAIASTAASIDMPVLWRSRRIHTTSPDALSSVSWIPSDKSALLAISKSGAVDSLLVHDPLETGWSPNDDLIVVAGDQCHELSPLSLQRDRNGNAIMNPLITPMMTTVDTLDAPKQTSSIANISRVMAERARHGYLLNAEENIRLLHTDEHTTQSNQALIDVWSWIFRMETLMDQGRTILAHRDFSYCNVITLLQANLPAASVVAPTDFSSSAGYENTETLRRLSSISGSITVPAKKPAAPTTAAMAYTAAINTSTSFTPVIPSSGSTSQSINTSAKSASVGSPVRSYRNALLEGLSPNANSISLADQKNTSAPPLSQQRILVLLMCGFTVGVESYEEFITKLEANGEFDKAAAWSLFHLNIQRCIKSLSMTSDERYKVIITALSGFFACMQLPPSAQLPHLSLWQESCRTMMSDIKEPFIRAIFAFVSSNGNLSAVLDEKTLSLHDRVAIATRFLPDDELIPYLKKLTKKVVMLGEIEGLLLTGFTFPACLDLLQQYLDKTGDLQTATLIMNCCPPRRFKDVSIAVDVTSGVGLIAAQRMNEWVELYRDLLDCWQLFHERCRFDIERRRRYQSSTMLQPTASQFSHQQSTQLSTISSSPTKQPHSQHPSTLATDKLLQHSYAVPSQIYVRCNFCNQSITHDNMFIPGVGLVGVLHKDSRLLVSAGRTADHLSSPQSSTHAQSGTSLLHSSSSASHRPIQQSLISPAGGPATAVNLHPSQRTKSIACPMCKKPLPRCSVCLLPMGTPLQPLLHQQPRTVGNETADVSISADISSPIGSWFAWCQQCKHGGHALHLQQWFREHTTCPVSECPCQCQSHTSE